MTARHRFVKSCSCGRAYFIDDWEALPLLGHGIGLEFRNCPACGSTMCIRRAAPKVYAAIACGGVGLGHGLTRTAARADAVLRAIGGWRIGGATC